MHFNAVVDNQFKNAIVEDILVRLSNTFMFSLGPSSNAFSFVIGGTIPLMILVLTQSPHY